MEKFIYHNKGFTLVELLVYIGIAAISFILILGIIYGIIYYTSFYFDKVTLSNEMFKILHKIYYNSIEAKNIQTTTSSISFEFNNSYEKLFASGSSL
ncbi:MAG: prepilin-type N-terminal cleavage/methylation domain-containing protein, partial [Candidatus Aenigmatarchaeota archaeon]